MRNAFATVIALVVLGAPPALAVHWPQLGGDAGRSGYQPLGDGTPPVQPLWTARDEGVVTSVLISAGRLAEQRVVYGTADGRVHIRRLLTGAAVGPSGGVEVYDSGLTSGVFGDGGGGSASFAESSSPGSLGAVFAVHNARNSTRPLLGGLDDDIEIAVLDEASGDLVQEVAVPGTIDHTVLSSAVLTPPDAKGMRRLLFLAGPVGGTVSLFAAEVSADRVGRVQHVEVPGANPLASPALGYLPAAGGERLHALVATSTGVRSFAVDSLATEGPRSTEPGGRVGTPAVPVAASGLLPGQAGSGAAIAPGVFVAATQDGQTRVIRLAYDGGELVLRAQSELLSGTAAPSLALAQEVVAGTAAAGWVVVTTDQDLYALDARTLQLVGRAGDAAAPPGPGRGFAGTVAAAAGRLAFAARDGGEPEVVDLQSVRVLGDPGFARQATQEGSARSVGQPALSRGLVVFASDRGVFAYRTRCGNAVGGTSADDILSGAAPGDAMTGRGGDDLLSGGDGDDCLDGGPGADGLRGDAGEDTIAGGEGDDRLNGGGGADSLTGGPGRDRLSAGAGPDRLAAGAHPDVLSAGAGDDRLNARGGGRDRLLCGAGSDVVLADRADRVARDCERVLRR